MSTIFMDQAERLKYDFERERKLGEESTARLLLLLLDMATEIDELKTERRHPRVR